MTSSDVVQRYIDALVAHDWDAVAATLAADVVRVGPYRDEYRGRDAYVAFLRDVLPSLPGYVLRVDRIVPAGSVVAVELSETVTINDRPHETPEALVFDVDDGVISRVGVYIQRAPSA